MMSSCMREANRNPDGNEFGMQKGNGWSGLNESASTQQTELVSEFRLSQRGCRREDAGDIMAGWREGGESAETGWEGTAGTGWEGTARRA